MPQCGNIINRQCNRMRMRFQFNSSFQLQTKKSYPEKKSLKLSITSFVGNCPTISQNAWRQPIDCCLAIHEQNAFYAMQWCVCVAMKATCATTQLLKKNNYYIINYANAVERVCVVHSMAWHSSNGVSAIIIILFCRHTN